MPDFFAPCPRGLENILLIDLQTMGAQNARGTEGGVHFTGDWALCYRANLESRIASRILWRVKETTYRTEQDIYKTAFDLQWQRWFDVTHTIRVNTTAIRCSLKSLEFITLLVKDAVCDRFRAHCNERPSVDTLTPDVRIHVFIENAKLMLYLDTSGDALFKRGVRSHTNIAPRTANQTLFSFVRRRTTPSVMAKSAYRAPMLMSIMRRRGVMGTDEVGDVANER